MALDRKTLLEKIKKCLALSQSCEPNEAAAALRQAQKLMERHGITREEIDGIGFGTEKVHVSQQSNKKSIPNTLSALIDLLVRAFGCRAIVGDELRVSDYSYVIHWFGPTDRVLLVTYAQKVMWRAMNSSYRAYIKEHPGYKQRRGIKSGFMLGWLAAVESQVVDFAMTDDEEARTAAIIERELGSKNIVPVKAKGMMIGRSAYDAGQEAADGFTLNRPVTRDNLRISK